MEWEKHNPKHYQTCHIPSTQPTSLGTPQPQFVPPKTPMAATHRDWEEPFSNSSSMKSSKNNTKPLHKLLLLWIISDRKSSPPENRWDSCCWTLSMDWVQEGNCCSSQQRSYRDGAATEGMALTKPVAPFLVSRTWSSIEIQKTEAKFIMLVRKKSLMILFHGIWKFNSFPFPAYKTGASPSLQGICTFLPPLPPRNLFYSKAPTSVAPKIAWYKSKLEQSIAVLKMSFCLLLEEPSVYFKLTYFFHLYQSVKNMNLANKAPLL